MKAPAGSLRYRHIHLAPGWLAKTGPTIGGIAPAKYAFTQGLPYKPGSALLAMTGIDGKYTDWLIGGKSFPWIPGTSNFLFNHKFTLNPDYLTAAQAIERDTKFTDSNGITYNGSTQWNLAATKGSMHFQVDKSGGGWVDTGIVLPAFTPGSEHKEQIQYTVDIVKKTYSVVAIEVDGITYALPATYGGNALANLPGSNVGWAKNEILPQLQQDGNATGGSWEWEVIDLSYDLW